jgi:hypothetical protein
VADGRGCFVECGVRKVRQADREHGLLDRRVDRDGAAVASTICSTIQGRRRSAPFSDVDVRSRIMRLATSRFDVAL